MQALCEFERRYVREFERRGSLAAQVGSGPCPLARGTYYVDSHMFPFVVSVCYMWLVTCFLR